MASNLIAMAYNLRAMASNLIAMASNVIAMASNLKAMAYNLRAMASNLIVMAYNLIAVASNLKVMAYNLRAMASNLINSDGLQPDSDGFQPNSDNLQPKSDGLQPHSDGLQPTARGGGDQSARPGLWPYPTPIRSCEAPAARVCRVRARASHGNRHGGEAVGHFRRWPRRTVSTGFARFFTVAARLFMRGLKTKPKTSTWEGHESNMST